MSPTQFIGVCLITHDVPRLRQFYEQVLQVKGEGDENHVDLSAQGAIFTLFSWQGMEEMAPGSMGGAGMGSVILEFQVANVDVEAQRLEGLGVPLVKPPLSYPWGSRSAWFRDPDGNIFNLYSVI